MDSTRSAWEGHCFPLAGAEVCIARNLVEAFHNRCLHAHHLPVPHGTGRHGAPRLSLEGRRCLDPALDERFVASIGEDRISNPARPRTGVEIWSLAAGLERARERFQQGRPDPLEGEEPAQAVTPLLSPGAVA